MIVLDFWIQVLLLAVLIDIFLGEPPEIIHPVVWMGKLIDFFVSHTPVHDKRSFGFLIAIFCTGAAVVFGLVLKSLGEVLLSLIICAFFLKSTFSIRMLLFSAAEIKKDLEKGRIEKVRGDLKTFVGRDTSGLHEHQAASAVIESLAESFVDGILSPLLYFLLFGLPGALACRMINTLDSMVGYKKEPFIELGYASAKLDDLVNWLPARISLIFIFIASIVSGKPLAAVKTCMHDHNKTASPNSGWPMSAVSGALNIRLEKIGFHVLGHNYIDPDPIHINKAINIVGLSSFLVVLGIFLTVKVPLFG